MTFDEKICEFLNEHLKVRSFDNIFTFLPTKNEPDILPIIKIYCKNKNIFVPAYRNRKWLITRLSNTHNLETNRFNILQPVAITETFNSLKNANFTERDICLIPGVLFSKDGERIGHGDGVYDQYLHSTITHNIGVTYEKFLTGRLPQRNKDLKLHAIITEKGIL